MSRLKMSHQICRVLVLGDAGIGKTSLARTITTGVFPAIGSLQQTPNSCQQELQTTPQTSITAGDVCHAIHIMEETDMDEGPGTGKQIDAVYLCFDVCCQATFDAIQTKWLPKAKSLTTKNKSGTALLLVGLKSDEVTSYHSNTPSPSEPQTPRSISSNAANRLANQIGAFVYVEVSALKYLGVEKLKEQTIFGRNVPEPGQTWTKKNKSCRLM